MRLFPHALVRVAGGPYEVLCDLRVEETRQLITQIIALEQERDSCRDQVCDAIFASVPDIQDAAVQKKMINLKRDIFNGRPLSDQKIALIRANLKEDALPVFNRFLECRAELETLDTRGAETFDKEIAGVRKRLHGHSRSDVVTKGLVLSSQTLLSGTSTYCRKGYDKAKKKDLKTELSLIQYLTRICGKTSPFSTFTNLVMAGVDDGDAPIRSVNPGTPEVVGQIRLNNALFVFLLEVLKAHPQYRLCFPVRPNPTLTREAETYLFLINSKNVESFQRIPLNPVLDLFWELAASNPEGLTIPGLVEAALEAVDASPEDLSAYIGQLLEFGFLEYNVGISGLDTDWDLRLGEKLAGWSDDLPFIGDLKAMLKTLREMADRYADVDFKGRIELLNQAFDRFYEICCKLHESAGLPEEERLLPEERRARLLEKEKEKKQEEGKDEDAETEEKDEEDNEEEEVFKHESQTHFNFKPEQVFYEDCILDAPFVCGAAGLKGPLEALDKLHDRMGLFGMQQDLVAKMHHYFQGNYEQDAVDLLSFYEHFYRDFKKPEMEHQKKRKEEAREKEKEEAEKKEKEGAEKDGEKKEEKKEPFAVIPAVEERQKLRKRVIDGMTALLDEAKREGAEPVVFNTAMIDAAMKELPEEARYSNPRQSCAAFLQFYGEGDDTRAVINSLPIGYGKLFSRFLHLFDPKITETLRDWSVETHPEARMLEDSDASTFNANLHPPLMPYEVWIPGGHNSLPPEKQIPVTELVVRNSGKTLELRHGPKDDRLYVFDLGFQSERGRSELFQLLKRFNPAEFMSVSQLVNDHLNKLPEGDDGVVYQPRVIFEDYVVANRAQWTFPSKTLPIRKPQETAWSYFRRVHSWKAAHNLPDEVFVSITHHMELEQLDDDSRKKVRRDDYKPQYFDFNNPILVRLFEKLVERVPRSMRLVEMLPASKDLVRIDGKRYVTEAVVQWHRKMEDQS
ncbi:MAG: lantibiotic dehydratase [Acidobacteriota bacterium]|nr:lantibiotic dehydratase [Acidobacteriota bacterium]